MKESRHNGNIQKVKDASKAEGMGWHIKNPEGLYARLGEVSSSYCLPALQYYLNENVNKISGDYLAKQI